MLFSLLILIIGNMIWLPKAQAYSYPVHASVKPARYIIVDSSHKIVAVISNTRLEVMPEVYRGALGKRQIKLDHNTEAQYQKIKKQINFSKTGIVYSKAHST
jgi:hypothetical protein